MFLITTIGCYVFIPSLLYITNIYLNNHHLLLQNNIIKYISKSLNKNDVIQIDGRYINITITGNKKRMEYIIKYILSSNVYYISSKITNCNKFYILNLKLLPYNVTNIKNNYKIVEEVNNDKSSLIII